MHDSNPHIPDDILAVIKRIAYGYFKRSDGRKRKLTAKEIQELCRRTVIKYDMKWDSAAEPKKWTGPYMELGPIHGKNNYVYSPADTKDSNAVTPEAKVTLVIVEGDSV